MRGPTAADGHRAHPVSLEIRDGRCRLHNHEAEGAELGGRKIPPGKSSDWGPGQVLRLSKDVKFRLMNRALPRKPRALPSPPRTANGQAASHVGSAARSMVRLGVYLHHRRWCIRTVAVPGARHRRPGPG